MRSSIRPSTIPTKPIENIEMTVVKIRPTILPRGFFSCIIASVYIPPKSTASNNTQKRDNREIINITKAISSAIDAEHSTQKQLLIICGDFNHSNSGPLCRLLDVKQINSAPTRASSVLAYCILSYTFHYFYYFFGNFLYDATSIFWMT